MRLSHRVENATLGFLSKASRRLRLPIFKTVDAAWHDMMLEYVREDYGDIIEKYKHIAPAKPEVIDSKSTIFVMWYQGEETMPPIVKACYANLKKRAGGHPVVLLTEKNIRQYVSPSPIWDDIIFKYVENKKIAIVKLADFSRLCLMYTYGGIWIDSTVWLNKDIDDIVSGLVFASGKRPDELNVYDTTEGKWSPWFIGSFKGNTLMQFVFEIMLEHIKREGKFLHYFMIDYAVVTAYHSFPYVREMIDAIPPMANIFSDFYPIRNKEFNQAEYEELTSKVPFYKMTYRGKSTRYTKEGKMTYFGYLTKDI